MKTLTFHVDPGHGWLEVPLTDLHNARCMHLISSYSYMDRQNAYLEEDCDAPRYLDALTTATGRPWRETITLRESYRENTPIRQMRHYDPIRAVDAFKALIAAEQSHEYQPKTGERCRCLPGVWRDNCPECEGTGWRIDFQAIRARHAGKEATQ